MDGRPDQKLITPVLGTSRMQGIHASWFCACSQGQNFPYLGHPIPLICSSSQVFSRQRRECVVGSVVGIQFWRVQKPLRSSQDDPHSVIPDDYLSVPSPSTQSTGSSELVNRLSSRANSGKRAASLARSGPVVNTTSKLGGCCSDAWNQAAS